jgi:hypothetical protein
VLNRLSNDIKMNSTDSVTRLFIPLKQEMFPRGRAPHEGRLVVHLDNCSVRTSAASTGWLEEHGIRCMPGQFYSPNLASSDFYLFSTVKKLERIQLADEDQLFEHVPEIARS